MNILDALLKDAINEEKESEQAQEEVEQDEAGLEEAQSEVEESNSEIRKAMIYENTNIIDKLDPRVITRIEGELARNLEMDIESRSEWIANLEEAKEYYNFSVLDLASNDKRAGSMGNSGGKGHLSSDKSIMLNQALTKSVAFLDSMFLSKELLVDFIVEDDEQKEAAAKLKTYFNSYLNNAQRDYREDKRVSLNYTVSEGVSFWNVYFDPFQKLVVSYHSPAEDVEVNATALSCTQALRISRKYILNRLELAQKIETKEFRDIQYSHSDGDEDGDNDDVLSMVDTSEELEEDAYTFYDIQGWADLKGDEYFPPKEGLLPYLFKFERKSRQLAGVYEFWDAEDTMFSKQHNIVKAPYFPSFGFWPYGLLHLAAPFVKSSTDVLRLMVNAASYSSIPTVIVGNNIKPTQNNILLEPGALIKLNNTGTHSLAESVSPLPFKEPSQYLDVIRNYFDAGVNDVVLSLSQMENLGNNTPVGTALMVVENASKVPNFIVKGLYEAFSEEFLLILKNLKKYQDLIDPAHMPFEFKELLNTFDFNGDIKIMPTANPTVSSQYMDIVKYEALLGLMEKYPDSFNKQLLLREYVVKALGVTNAEELLAGEEEEGVMLPPLAENNNIMAGAPIKAFKGQHHEAHIMVHNNLAETLASNNELDPNMKNQLLMVIAKHVNEHTELQDLEELELELGGKDLGEDISELSPELQNQLALMEATRIAEAAEAAQQEEGAPPVDEASILQAQVEVDAQANQVEAQKAQANFEIEQMKLQLDEQRIALEASQKEHELRIQEMKIEIEIEKLRQKQHMDEVRNATELQKANAAQQLEMTKIANQREAELQKILARHEAPLPPPVGFAE